MSKHAGAVAEETKRRILAAAADEFSQYGFQGSSLRRISSAAGVTTGAVYFFFSGKDELFQTLLSQITEPFNKLLMEHYENERASSERDSKKGEDADFEVSRLLIEFYFSNRQIWDILTKHLNYPAVQAFLDKFVDESSEHYMYLLKDTQRKPADAFAIHQFVHMQLDTMLTLITHDFDKDAMINHSKTVIKMLRGAFSALLNE